jgi:septal ring factor EnvC (AmiA/AmiB activator)
MYLSDHSKNLISAEEKVAELIKQRDQLRAEVERLNDQLAKAVWDTDVNRANARADKAEAELAAERARLDWVEKHGPWDQWNGFRQTGITLHENIRASIDAAIKEGK